jgi:hypothetical protein
MQGSGVGTDCLEMWGCHQLHVSVIAWGLSLEMEVCVHVCVHVCRGGGLSLEREVWVEGSSCGSSSVQESMKYS